MGTGGTKIKIGPTVSTDQVIADINTHYDADIAILSNRVNYEIYVEDYGAKGDGVTDDTVAIQNAINASKNVRFRAKTYLISSGLILKQYGSTLIGSGHSTIIQASRKNNIDSYAVFTGYNRKYVTTDLYPDTITDMTINCNSQSLSGLNYNDVPNIHLNNACAIHLRYADYSRIDNVKILDAGLASITIEWSSYCFISNCRSLRNGYIRPNLADFDWWVKANGNAFSFTDGSFNTIENCYAYNPRDLGGTLWNEQDSMITNCTTNCDSAINTPIVPNGRSGFSIESSSNNCVISDCNGFNNWMGILIASNKSTVKNNNFINASSGIIMATDASNTFVTGNKITNPGSGEGINISSLAKNVVVSNNVINTNYNLMATTCEGLSIKNNEFISTSPYASVLVFNQPNSNVVIKDNVFRGKFQYGIQLATVTHANISNNVFIGGTSAPIYTSNCDYITIEKNTIKNDSVSGISPTYSIYMDSTVAVSGTNILNNNISGYTIGDGSMPYGMYIQSTCLPLIVHTDLTKPVVAVNSLLYAKAGSMVQGLDVTRGTKMFIKTGNINTNWVANYFSLT